MFLLGIILARLFLVHGQTCSTFNIPQDRLNSALTKNVAKIFLSSRDLTTCANSCMYFTVCLGVNFSIKDKVCEWLFSFNDLSRMVRGIKGYVYLSMFNDWKQVMNTNPCSNKPCHIGQDCVPNKDSYICRTSDFDYCDKLYFTFLEKDEYKQIVHIPTLRDGSSIDDIWLYSNSGVVLNSSISMSYIQVNLTRKPFIVKGIITKGNPDLKAVVYSFWISTSPNCTDYSYTYITNGTEGLWNFKNFIRDKDYTAQAINYLDEPMSVACLRLHVRGYIQAPALRMDLIGCIK